ncbi:MAG: hypothetical protein JWQ76_669 [Ramlibacter sp.]|nr:hypothetical protein [Ramlibacter sp.]
MTANREEPARQDTDSPPSHGHSGRGAASILPHLNRQQQSNDKPAPEDHPTNSQQPRTRTGGAT